MIKKETLIVISATEGEQIEKSKLKRAEVFEMLKIFNDQEKHFNEMEKFYRTLASSWLLAGIAATGFILTSPNANIAEYWYVGSFVSLLTSFGILLLWSIDARGYHKLTNSIFRSGMALENEYSYLPQYKNDMYKVMNEKDATSFSNWFYLVPAIFMMIMFFFFNFYDITIVYLNVLSSEKKYTIPHLNGRTISAIVFFIIFLVLAIGIWRSGRINNVS